MADATVILASARASKRMFLRTYSKRLTEADRIDFEMDWSRALDKDPRGSQLKYILDDWFEKFREMV
jgi:hypothetical protein